MFIRDFLLGGMIFVLAVAAGSYAAVSGEGAQAVVASGLRGAGGKAEIPQTVDRSLIASDEQKRRLFAGWEAFPSVEFPEGTLVEKKATSKRGVLEIYEVEGKKQYKLIIGGDYQRLTGWQLGQYQFQVTFEENGQPIWVEANSLDPATGEAEDGLLYLVISTEGEPRSFLHSAGGAILLEYLSANAGVKYRWFGEGVAADYDESGKLLVRYFESEKRDWNRRGVDSGEAGRGSFDLRLDYHPSVQ